MADLKRVTSLLEGDMAAFKPKFRAAVTTDVALLDTVMRYILRRKGKQMRPMFVFLSARLHSGVDAQGAATDRAHTAAALIELLHTATLVHDDVVDESPLRRGVFSIQALWKKKVAVLVGDYLLSRGLLAAVDAEAYDLLKITSRAVREMSEGELLQIEKARRLDITEEVYFTSSVGKPPRSWQPAARAGPPPLAPKKPRLNGCGASGNAWGWRSKFRTTCSTLAKATGPANPLAKTSASAK